MNNITNEAALIAAIADLNDQAENAIKRITAKWHLKPNQLFTFRATALGSQLKDFLDLLRENLVTIQVKQIERPITSVLVGTE